MSKLSLPIKCERCHQVIYLYLDDAQIHTFVVCHNCGWETSYTICPECEIGGNFINNLLSRPNNWHCPECQKVYPLPTDFYQKQVLTTAARKQDLDTLVFQDHLCLAFLHHDKQKKWQDLMFVAILGIPFVSLIPFFVASSHDAPLWPLGLLILTGVGWSIYVGIRHKTMLWEDFEKLPESSRRKRMYYESFWWYLHRGGIALLCSAALVWGLLIHVVNFGGEDRLKYLILSIILLSFLVFILVLTVKALSLFRQQYLKWQQLKTLAGLGNMSKDF